MYIMNLIHDICLTKNSINNTPKWRFITKNKQTKKLNKNIAEFLELDVFSASNNIITFLNSLDREIVTSAIGSIWFTTTFIALDVYDKNNIETNITYYPESGRFEIWNNNVSYTIYRNNKVSNKINKMWEPLVVNIKKKYLDIIIKIADYIISLDKMEVK